MTETTGRTRGCYCRRCGYDLRLHVPGRCPECGKPFDPRDPLTFDHRPSFLFWKLWLPGIALAAGLGGTMAAALTWSGSLGLGLVVGVPIAIGCVIGTMVRAPWFLVPLAALAVSTVVVCTLLSLDLSGLFCGSVLAIVFLVPMLVGAFIGAMVRQALLSNGYATRLQIVAAALLIPAALAIFDARPARTVTVAVSTDATFDATVDEVWRALQLYEEVGAEPPLLLRLGLPNPRGTRGSMSAVGDVKVCLYDKGQLTKVIVERTAPTHLGFVVTDQRIGFERSVRLTGGSFHLEPLGAHRTTVTLTTDYTALLRPRFAWSWAEDLAVHTLHRHVLNGMTSDLEAARRLAAGAIDRGGDDDPGS